MSENLGLSFEREHSAERRRVMRERLGYIAQRSAAVGVELNYLVADQNLRPIAARGESEPFFAAGIGTLPMALKVLDSCDFSPEVDDCLDGMLAFPGDKYYAKLAEMLGGPQEIQAFFSNWRHTSVYEAENGKTGIGDTTPAEALMQLRLLLAKQPGVDPVLDQTVKNALLGNEVYNHGIRQVVQSPHPDVSIWNKSGEHNGDENTPYSVRHDVGALNTLRSHDFLFYSFMTRSPKGKAGGWLGDQVVALATAEALVAMGHHDYLRMGAKAMRLSGVRPLPIRQNSALVA